jgi:hypothetical protein
MIFLIFAFGGVSHWCLASSHIHTHTPHTHTHTHTQCVYNFLFSCISSCYLDSCDFHIQWQFLKFLLGSVSKCSFLYSFVFLISETLRENEFKLCKKSHLRIWEGFFFFSVIFCVFWTLER